MASEIKDNVKEYYGKILQTNEDLKTNVCVQVDKVPKQVREALIYVLKKSYRRTPLLFSFLNCVSCILKPYFRYYITRERQYADTHCCSKCNASIIYRPERNSSTTFFF